MDSNLFVIKNSTDNSKIGKAYPQVDGMGNDYNFKKPNSVNKIANYRQLDFLPDLDFFKISNSAKLTDFISTGLIYASGFLVSEKVKQIFDQYVISKHTYYPARLKYKMHFYENYFWLHFIENDNEIIEFANSSFVLTHPLPFFREDEILLTFESQKEALSSWEKNNDERLFPRKLTIGNNSQDLFSFSFLYNNHYISYRLVEHLKSEDISGFDILNTYL